MVIDDTDDSFDLNSSMDSGINSSQNSGTHQIKNISLNSSQEGFAETLPIKNISRKNPKTHGNFEEIYFDLSRFSSTMNPDLVKSDGSYQKPPLTYRFLVTLALKAKRNRCSTANDMIFIIKCLFPYFKDTQALRIQSIHRTLGLTGSNSDGSKSKVKNCFRKLPNSELGGDDVWTFENKQAAAELDKDLRLGFFNSTNYNGINAATPMPDILWQIIQEPIDLHGNQIEVCTILFKIGLSASHHLDQPE